MTTDDELIDAMLVAMYDDGCPGAVDSMRAVLAVVRAHDRDGVVAEYSAAKAASMLAYGYLWSVQIEPGTPGLAPHKAVPAARIVLRDVLDNDKRKAGIEQVRAALGER